MKYLLRMDAKISCIKSDCIRKPVTRMYWKSLIVIMVLGLMISCGVTKTTADTVKDKYEIVILAKDGSSTVGDVIAECFQLRPSGPLEITQSNNEDEILEIRMPFVEDDKERIDLIRNELLKINNIIKITIRKL